MRTLELVKRKYSRLLTDLVGMMTNSTNKGNSVDVTVENLLWFIGGAFTAVVGVVLGSIAHYLYHRNRN